MITEIIKGNTKALEQLFSLLKNTVFNVALGYTRNREDAEEITQDVFVEIYESAATFKGESSVKTWACRITINKSLDFIRYKNRKKRFALLTSLVSKETGEVKFHQPDFNHPGVSLENKEKAQYLFAAIDRLPDNQRTAFILLKLEGMSQREAAETMQLNEKALESLYQRAKQNLRKALSDIYDEL
ncbi:MAG: RNA polymerase sigma factor [Chitinophagales bacterium]|nr:RNA polymerase sigma factor [Chitinophagales bacterium]